MSSSFIFQIQSVIIVCLLIYGVTQRKNKYKHIKIMRFSIIWDLLLVAQIELTRGAIVKASKAMTNPLILNIHVSLAIGTVLLYALIFYTGTKLKSGDESIRAKHKIIGICTLTTRLSTFITSFLIN